MTYEDTTLPHRRATSGTVDSRCGVCHDSFEMTNYWPDGDMQELVLDRRHTVDKTAPHMFQNVDGDPDAPCEHCKGSKDAIIHLDFRKWNDIRDEFLERRRSGDRLMTAHQWATSLVNKKDVEAVADRVAEILRAQKLGGLTSDITKKTEEISESPAYLWYTKERGLKWVYGAVGLAGGMVITAFGGGALGWWLM